MLYDIPSNIALERVYIWVSVTHTCISEITLACVESDSDVDSSVGNLTRAVNPIRGLGKDYIVRKYCYEI